MTEITDMLFEIFQELPVKSLMRFKCVSKTWFSVIEDPIFVDSHRLRSHTRPGGINLLGYKLLILQRQPLAFLLDPEGNLRHIELPNPKNAFSWPKAKQSRHVEGLVCYENFIWNPSTRKTIKLPDQCGLIPFFQGAVKYEILNQYMLGFDAPSKKYKVLSICSVLVYNPSETIIKKQTLAQVLTLGTNSWRNLDCMPEKLKQGIQVITSCYINNIMFFLISFDQVSDENTNARTRQSVIVKALMIFEVGKERFRMIELPKSCSKGMNFIFEASGRLGFWDEINFLWILEDYEKEIWTKRQHTIPHGIGHESIVPTPIGSVHTREILFEARSIFPLDPIYFFYYDLDTGNTRFFPSIKVHPELRGEFKLSKHVETVFPFKEG